jgi:hypothetical protein
MPLTAEPNAIDAGATLIPVQTLALRYRDTFLSGSAPHSSALLFAGRASLLQKKSFDHVGFAPAQTTIGVISSQSRAEASIPGG